MMTNKTTLYFGYGANKNPYMMKAIIGRVPKGDTAQLSGFELCVQHWDEMPKPVRTMLQNSWDNKFKSYIIRPTTKDTSVSGIIWHLTPFERKLIDN